MNHKSKNLDFVSLHCEAKNALNLDYRQRSWSLAAGPYHAPPHSPCPQTKAKLSVRNVFVLTKPSHFTTRKFTLSFSYDVTISKFTCHVFSHVTPPLPPPRVYKPLPSSPSSSRQISPSATRGTAYYHLVTVVVNYLY